MLNQDIVKAGYANLITIPPNVKYQERFLKAYGGASENGKGFWNKPKGAHLWQEERDEVGVSMHALTELLKGACKVAHEAA